ncbi:MAG TPA: twin-arginine translocase TatA/TatE family subunit [Allosphingosinicella sp.]
MGGFSIWHWLVVGVIILLLFGKGRFSDMMGDVAKGLKSFKKGMTEEEETPARTEEQKRLKDSATLEVPVDRTRDIDPADRREP